MKEKIKQFLIRWFHPTLHGKMPIVVSDELLQQYDLPDKRLTLKIKELLDILCKTYKVPYVELEIFTNKDEYLKRVEDGIILNDNTAGVYYNETYTIVLLTKECGTINTIVLFHEFYHHLDYKRNNGIGKWSTHNGIAGDCNNESQVFAIRYDQKLTRLKKLQSSNTS